MVTIVMPVFANISKTEHATAVKLHMDYEKNMSNILVLKSQKRMKKCWENQTELNALIVFLNNFTKHKFLPTKIVLN